jgi:hypothetical protein
MKAHWNKERLTWQVSIEEPRGDRYEITVADLNTAQRMLKDRQYKFLDTDSYNNKPCIVLVDYAWFIDNHTNIDLWAEESEINFELTGMLLTFESESAKMLFILRWS